MVDFSAGPQLAVCLLAKASKCWLWHRRLGHAGMRNLHTLVKKKHVIGIEGVKFKKDHLCGACKAGKMTRAKHPSKTIMTTSQPFELLHMDLFGPTNYSTLTTTACLYGVRTPTRCHIDLACNTSYHFAASRTVFPRVSPYLYPGPFEIGRASCRERV